MTSVLPVTLPPRGQEWRGLGRGTLRDRRLGAGEGEKETVPLEDSWIYFSSKHQHMLLGSTYAEVPYIVLFSESQNQLISNIQ